jgi:hypothetical protein
MTGYSNSYFQSTLEATETNRSSMFHVNFFWNIVTFIFMQGSETANAISTRSAYIKRADVPYPLKLHFPTGVFNGISNLSVIASICSSVPRHKFVQHLKQGF